MANFCPECGHTVTPDASFCSMCGARLDGSSASGNANYANAYGNASSALGTLVAVTLASGLTRQLFYYGGRYYTDPMCRIPFADAHLILGAPRRMYMRPAPMPSLFRTRRRMPPPPPHGGPAGGPHGHVPPRGPHGRGPGGRGPGGSGGRR